METLVSDGNGTFMAGPNLELGRHDPEDVVCLWCPRECCPSVGQSVRIDSKHGLVMSTLQNCGLERFAFISVCMIDPDYKPQKKPTYTGPAIQVILFSEM